MLLRKNIRAAGELEGGKARLKLDYSHQKKPELSGFLTSVARFFMKRKLHKKCGVIEACKKVTDFFDTLRGSLLAAPKSHVMLLFRRNS